MASDSEEEKMKPKPIECSVCGKAYTTMYKCPVCGAYFCQTCAINASGNTYCPNCSRQCYEVEQEYVDGEPTKICSVCGNAEDAMNQCGNCGAYFCENCAVEGSNGLVYCPRCSPMCKTVKQQV